MVERKGQSHMSAAACAVPALGQTKGPEAKARNSAVQLSDLLRGMWLEKSHAKGLKSFWERRS